MPNDLIRYDLLVQEALCGVVKKVLVDAARNGLPGDHHFYITFRTNAPGVKLSNRMRERYPEEMTIILQHQFDGLKVNDYAFEVGLSFNGIPEILVIPFAALTGFFDPSVHFSAKFEPQPDADGEEMDTEPATPPISLPAPTHITAVTAPGASSEPKRSLEPVSAGGETEETKVVSIDAFRKKP